MNGRSQMPEPDEGFEELFFADRSRSLANIAPAFEKHLNQFSDVRNVQIQRLGEHEGDGWILRFHAPIGEFEALGS